MWYWKRNLPALERALRVGGGLALLGAALWLMPEGGARWIAAAAGACGALSGVVGWCPMCALAGRRLGKP
jgi:hypothetical protein